MFADSIRHFYDYHFRVNRIIWSICTKSLSDEQFDQAAAYSHGSVREQILHLLRTDENWFCELRGVQPAEPFPPADFGDRKNIRTYWDGVEQMMREYLAGLSDEALLAKPIKEPEEDRDLTALQVLLHVANHGTDHRAQLLRSMHDLGVETPPQDYVYYIYGYMG